MVVLVFPDRANSTIFNEFNDNYEEQEEYENFKVSMGFLIIGFIPLYVVNAFQR